MSEQTLTKTRLRAGVWEGVLRSAVPAPAIEVLLEGQAIDGVSLTAIPGAAGEWALRAPIAAEHLSDGVQTYLIRDAASGEALGHFTVITGAAPQDDLRAEVDLLREELDMLKRAFRRHCVETAG
ncbi:MAG: hypothetical protein ACT4N9_05845 [Paracoccaceae bacterium]